MERVTWKPPNLGPCHLRRPPRRSTGVSDAGGRPDALPLPREDGSRRDAQGRDRSGAGRVRAWIGLD